MTKNRIELSTFQAKAKKIQGATPTNRRLNSYFVHVGDIKHKKVIWDHLDALQLKSSTINLDRKSHMIIMFHYF